jgi:putative holliday junction resolvase
MIEKKIGRIIAIDYGLKRVGIAVTDPLQIIATPFTTIASATLFFFKRLLSKRNRCQLCDRYALRIRW